MSRNLTKYFFETSKSEKCYTREYFNRVMNETGQKQMEVFTARQDWDSPFFYCQASGECGEKQIPSTCGRQCPDYAPCSTKGRCRHYRPVRYPDKKVIIRRNHVKRRAAP